MKRVISFALGNVCKWSASENLNDLFGYIRGLGVDGAEITFASEKELHAFYLSKENERWLKSLQYVTIHYPWEGIERENEAGIRGQMDRISELYERVDAENLIVHPLDLPGPEILNNCGLRVSTENLSKKYGISVAGLMKVFDKYPDIGLCLDTAHAYSHSRHETGKLVEAFRGKITQIHLSGSHGGKSHQSLRSMGEDFIYSIEPVLSMEVPVVIEENMEMEDERYLKDEVEFIRKMLNNY